jgi:lysyl-tRNA synthetase, class II
MATMIERIRDERIEKIKKLKKLGKEPYPARVKRTNENKEIVENFDKFENSKVTVVGRIMSWRDIGKIIFANLTDESGKIQLYIKRDNISKELWEEFKLYDIADFVEATGTVVKTKTGEISVEVSEIRIICKAIRPLPEKWTGLKDEDIRFRRRYLDMTMNPEIRERFKRRSQFWQATRDFLNEKGFVEINIPVLEHVTGGADAKPFVTHYDDLGEDFYLRISHELPLKRLLGGGFEKVYDIGTRFRNEGCSDEHLPEHVAMEFYWAYADYNEGMKLTQDMFRYILEKIYGTLKFKIRDFDVDLSKEWERIGFEDLLKSEYKGIDIYNDSVEDLNKILQKNGVDLGEDVNRARVVDNLWKLLRKKTAGPIFLTKIPKFLSPLAKTDPEDDRVVERFFPIIGGSEMANAFSELNDPIDQLDRFVEQQRMRDAGDEEAQMLDIDFVEMLEYGMPPAVGFGMSERVFWLFEGVTAREGVPFPQLKTEFEKSTLNIYKDISKYFKKKKEDK